MDTFTSDGDNTASADQVYDLEKVYVLVTAIPYFVLIWDWLANISKEYALVFRTNGNSGGNPFGKILSIKTTFMASRYITLVWCTFVVVVLGNVGNHPALCSWAKYFPYGYSTTMLFAHFVMVLRMYYIYERRKKILVFLLVLTSLDYALQMSANHAATTIYLSSATPPNLSVCFIIPTSLLYALVFISPTIFHHIVLAMTLYKSIQHIRATRAGGIKSIMNIVQRDQILFVLAICLINFANLVLVLQRSSWPYRLINQLPAAAFTQIFLSRIIFNLAHVQKKLASASVSPVISTYAMSPSSRRGEFNFSTTESANDLEFGGSGGDVDTKSPSSFMTPDSKQQNRKDFLSGAAGHENHNKKNVFTLKFDPSTNRRATAAHSPNTRNSPSSILNKNGFNVQQAKMESHALSSYKLPSPLSDKFGLDEDEDEGDEEEFDLKKGSYTAPSPRYTKPEEINPLSSSTLSASISPTPPSVETPVRKAKSGHQRKTSSQKLDLSPYLEAARQGSPDPTAPQVQVKDQEHVIHKAAPTSSEFVQSKVQESNQDSQIVPGGTTAEPTRTSFESLGRRASRSIDEQQKTMDWEPPAVWGSTSSPRASPIPFSERRLSNSIARSSSLSTHRSRSRHTSFGANKAIRPSFEGASSVLQQQQSGTGGGTASANDAQVKGQHRGSACYASIFTFEGDDHREEEDAEQIQPIPKDEE